MSPTRIAGPSQVDRQLGRAQTGRPSASPTASFESTLRTEKAKQANVTFSAHAVKRLAERNLSLSDRSQARLNAAVDRAQSKGADKSLVLLDDLALVVSARNRVVITAVDSASAREGVFSNIDSAVIA